MWRWNGWCCAWWAAAFDGRPGLMDWLRFDREHLWHPYASVLDPPPVWPVVSASGNRLRLADGRELVDGMASWWCAIHGYNVPELNEAAAAQLSRMSHVMFGGLTHEPAARLGQRLLQLAPDGLDAVFFADSGSVAVEVALKMALQYWRAQGVTERSKLLTIRRGYHGDTLGAMSVCDPDTGMHHLFAGMLPEQLFVDAPPNVTEGPWDDACLDGMRQALARDGERVAAVILEPVVQGAGGMRIYHPEFLQGVRKLCDEYGALLILDEIATGFGRTGRLFACEHAQVAPDIMCLGKALTGGYLTLAAVLASRRVAEGVEAGGHVLMHGPTFMANPLACAVANASIELLLASPWRQRVQAIEQGLKEGLAPCRRLPGVRDVRVLGAIGVVEMTRPVDARRAQPMFVERGVWIRPFANLIYVMPPYVTGGPDVRRLARAMYEVAEILSEE